MPATLTIRDEATDGGVSNTLVLEFLTERITVRELIRSRVYQEVQDHNRNRPERFRGLVQPEARERTLNDGAPANRRPQSEARAARTDDRPPNAGGKRVGREVDWKRQFEVACAAFERRGFLVLVGERQVTELEEEIELRPGVEATFLKLTPLVGG